MIKGQARRRWNKGTIIQRSKECPAQHSRGASLHSKEDVLVHIAPEEPHSTTTYYILIHTTYSQFKKNLKWHW